MNFSGGAESLELLEISLDYEGFEDVERALSDILDDTSSDVHGAYTSTP